MMKFYNSELWIAWMLMLCLEGKWRNLRVACERSALSTVLLVYY